MTEDPITLTTFYTSWKAYQEHFSGAIAPLTADFSPSGLEEVLAQLGLELP